MEHYETTFFCPKDKPFKIHIEVIPEDESWPVTIKINTSNSAFDRPKVVFHLESQEMLSDFLINVDDEHNRIAEEIRKRNQEAGDE